LSHRLRLAAVAGEGERARVGAKALDPPEPREGVVAAPVVDQDDLEAPSGQRRRREGARVEAARLVEAGDDQGDAQERRG
jgi:hypothetical protein